MSSVSGSVGASKGGGGFSPTGGAPQVYQHGDKSSNIMHAAISDGELIIRDTENQIQDINELSHNTEHVHNKLKPMEVFKEVYFKYGDSCTPEDYQKAFQEAGLANHFEQFTEEQRKVIYMIPWVGLVYGGFDSIKEDDITSLLQA